MQTDRRAGKEGVTKMVHITLLCDNGMSTSMMVQRMQKCAAERGIEADIMAVSVKAMKERLKVTDVLLLGPRSVICCRK